MPKTTDGPERDPMAGEVERLLRQLSQPAARTAPPRPSEAGTSVRPSPRPRTISLPTPLGVWLRAGVGVVLAAAMTQWPYRLCGLPLAGYLAVTTVLAITGIWAGHAAWRRRMGAAHVVAIALVFTAFALAALQLLPRVGYGPVTLAWRCVG